MVQHCKFPPFKESGKIAEMISHSQNEIRIFSDYPDFWYPLNVNLKSSSGWLSSRLNVHTPETHLRSVLNWGEPVEISDFVKYDLEPSPCINLGITFGMSIVNLIPLSHCTCKREVLKKKVGGHRTFVGIFGVTFIEFVTWMLAMFLKVKCVLWEMKFSCRFKCGSTLWVFVSDYRSRSSLVRKVSLEFPVSTLSKLRMRLKEVRKLHPRPEMCGNGNEKEIGISTGKLAIADNVAPSITGSPFG